MLFHGDIVIGKKIKCKPLKELRDIFIDIIAI
jgi:hypothetical protein